VCRLHRELSIYANDHVDLTGHSGSMAGEF
jgi:hypothetical protein